MKVLLVTYDNESTVNEFPLNLAYLSSALREAGHSVTIYPRDIYHYPDSHLTNYLDKNSFDIVGLGLIAGYWQYQQFLRITKAINNSVNRKNFSFILGGHMFVTEPEYFLRKGSADVVVIGEGERTIVELIQFAGAFPLSEIDGVAFLENNHLVITKPREQIQDLDSLPFPAWDLFDINHYCLSPFPGFKNTDRLMPVLASRGCPYKCNFCLRLMKGIRFRSPENVVEEIKTLQSRYNITGIIFHDECFMGDIKHTTEMCNAIIKENLDIRFTCDGRLNFARPDLLKLMKKAGCIFINYGIESFDDQVMKNMHKCLDTKTVEEGLIATLKEGIHSGINIIFGNIGDNQETLRKGVDLTLKYTDHVYQRTVRPVTPYPGSELYDIAIKKGLIKDIQDFYENKHLNSDLMTCNFTDLTDEQFYCALFDANKTLIKDQLDFQFLKSLEVMRKMYNEGDASFRGFRQT